MGELIVRQQVKGFTRQRGNKLPKERQKNRQDNGNNMTEKERQDNRNRGCHQNYIKYNKEKDYFFTQNRVWK